MRAKVMARDALPALGLLLVLYPWAWWQGWPVGLLGLAGFTLWGAWRWSRPSLWGAAGASVLLVLGSIGADEEPDLSARLDQQLEQVTQGTVTAATLLAASPTLRNAMFGVRKVELFQELVEVTQGTPADFGAMVLGPAGEPLAWAGWTPSVDGGLPEGVSSPHLEVRSREPYSTLRVLVPVDSLGFVVVGRTVEIASPLVFAGLESAIPLRAGLHFRSLLVPLRADVDRLPLDGGTGTPIASLDAPLGSVSGSHGGGRARVLPLGLVVALVLLLRTALRARGGRACALGWGGIALARGLALEWPVLGDSAMDPGEFAHRIDWLITAFPWADTGFLGSPGDAFLSIVALNLALILAVREALAHLRRADHAGVAAWLSLPLTALATLAWLKATTAFAIGASTPPFVNLTELLDPPVFLVATSVALVSVGLTLVLLGTGAAWASARPRALGENVWGVALGVVAIGPSLVVAPVGVVALLVLVAALMAHQGASMVRRRRVTPVIWFAVIPALGMASAGVLRQQQSLEFEDFAERQAERAVRQGENYQVLLLESAVADMLGDGALVDALEGRDPGRHAAFHAWLVSSLSAGRQPCDVQLLDSAGKLVSRFRIDMPGQLTRDPTPGFAHALLAEEDVGVRRARRRVGQREAELLIATARVPSERGEGRVSVAVLPEGQVVGDRGGNDRLAQGELGRRLSRWGVDPVVLLYRDGVLVESNDPGAPIGDLLPKAAEVALERTDESNDAAGWRRFTLGETVFEVYWFLQPSGEVLGLGRPVSFTLDSRVLILDSIAVHGVVIALLWLGLAIAAGWMPRLGSLSRQFRVRLLAAIAVVGVIPIVFWGVTGVRQLQAEQGETIRAEMEAALDIAIRGMELELAIETDRLLERADLSEWLVNENEDFPEGAQVLAGSAYLAGVRILDEDGLERARVGSSTDVPWRALQTVLRDDESRTLYTLLDDTPAAVLIRPIKDRRGNIVGAVAAYRTLGNRLCNTLQELLFSEVRIYGPATIAAGSRPELVDARLVPRFLPGGVWRAIMDLGRPGIVRSEIGPLGGRLTGYRALRASDVVAIGAIALSVPDLQQWVRNREIERSVSLIVGLSILWIGIAGLAAVVLSARISGPLGRLIQGAERIRGGQLGHQVEAHGHDEVARLMHSFNAMSRAVADSQGESERQRASLETIVEHLEAAVIAVADDATVQMVNRRATQIFGAMSPEVGGDLVEFLERIDLPGAEQLWRELEQRPRVTVELPFGEHRTLRVAFTRIAGGSLLVVEDLTDLIRSQKTIAWGQMARQVAHEIKNPLTPMKLQAQNLIYAYDRRPETFGETLRESVATIVEQIERLRRISGEFSRVARPDSMGRDRIDLAESVREVLRIYEGDGGGVQLKVELEDELPEVCIDREDVARVVLNLVENAREAMADSSTSGRPGQVSVWVSAATDGSVELGVADMGPGVPDGERARLFEPYFSTKSSGTGLGLFIVKKIVDGCDATIELRSAADEGATFTIRFPAAT